MGERSATRVGTIIADRWRLERLIDAGGMASVYEAVHRSTGYRVAVKVMHDDRARSPVPRALFLREGYLANLVEHPGVVKVIDDGFTDDGCPYLILELQRGESVEARRKRHPQGRLPVHEAIRIALEALDILAAAHDAELVHRDVKTTNLFYTDAGTTKLLDFGIAAWSESDDVGRDRPRAGVGAGTLVVMAPEQITGEGSIDARADIFSLGSSLYRMLSGTNPFAGPTVLDYLQAVRGAQAPRLDRLVPEVTTEIAEVVAKALSFDVADRWRSARAMSAALSEAALGATAERVLSTASQTVIMPSPVEVEVEVDLEPTARLATTSSRPPLPPPSSRPPLPPRSSPAPARASPPPLPLLSPLSPSLLPLPPRASTPSAPAYLRSSPPATHSSSAPYPSYRSARFQRPGASSHAPFLVVLAALTLLALGLIASTRSEAISHALSRHASRQLTGRTQ